MTNESESRDARAEGVSRRLKGEEAPSDSDRKVQVGPTGGEEGEMAPEGVGESVARRGEDMAKHHGKEAGRHDSGSDGSNADRPTGGSTARDSTGVDPQEGPDR
jgi:hypothetical protein